MGVGDKSSESSRIASPWWLTGLLVLGLVSLFMGERGFAHTSIAAQLSWFGSALVAVSLALRGWVISKSSGSQRRIELISSACHLGLLVALIGYGSTTGAGMDMLGITQASSVERWLMAMRVVWMIVLVCSLVPLVLIEIALGFARRQSFRKSGMGVDASVDLFRVREIAGSGLSMALAAAFLMVTCNIAEQHNIRRDVSYFKTSSAGSATANMVRSLHDPLRVLLFFPENSEVSAEVVEYLKSLQDATGRVEYEVHDRLLDAALAEKYKVGRDGMMVLLRDDNSEKFSISPDIAIARRRSLRELDSEFQKALMSVIRDTKTAYFMVGHGELNDPKSAGALGNSNALKKSTLIRTILKQLNYKVLDYRGFGKPVPDNCSLLFILAPRTALLPEELRAVDDYLGAGGAAIITLDPKSGMRLGLLSKRLGLVFNPAPISDDKEFMVRRGGVSDHSLVLTNQFLSHASITTLSQGAARSAILFVSPGSFDDAPFAKGSEKGSETTKVAKVIRSMKTSFREVLSATGSRNFVFDKSTEKRGRFTIVAAVETAHKSANETAHKDAGESSATTKTPETPGMRVALIADAEVLSDAILGSVAVVQNMLVDLIKWTGGEESLGGETISEKDMRIEHTKSQDAKWFYGTMVGAPLLMLLMGLFFVRRRRREPLRRAS